MVVSFQDDGGFAHGIARVGTVSGTVSISWYRGYLNAYASTRKRAYIRPTTQKNNYLATKMQRLFKT